MPKVGCGGTLLPVQTRRFASPLTVQVTTHAVLNAVRRLVMILFTSYFFGEPRTLVNTIGVLVAVAGVCAYAFASKRVAPAPHRTEAFDRTV